MKFPSYSSNSKRLKKEEESKNKSDNEIINFKEY